MLFGLAKIATHQFNWEFWVFDSLTGTLFAAASFIVAFMLSGTLRDYTTSAYIPIEIVNAIAAIEDANQLAAQTHADYDAQPLTVELTALIQAILAWLQAGQSAAPIEAALEKLNSHFSHLLASGDVPVVSRAQGEQAKIRLLINRIQQIRDTDFLKPAYALLEIFLVGAALTLVLIKTTSFMQNLVVSALLFTAFAYLLQLIRDLDNPFQYEGRSNLDVDLTVLGELRDRLTAQAPQHVVDNGHPQRQNPSDV